MYNGVWQHDLLDCLAASLPAGYEQDNQPASEPTAIAGLALLGHGRVYEARTAAHWLADGQAADGSVGVAASRPTPCWPTSWAMLLWQAVDAGSDTPDFTDRIERAASWTLRQQGQTLPRKPLVGHDSTLVGWPWAEGTHSWLEPTALFILALKAVGHSQHARTREGVRLVVDRLLPAGGCNYGNTIVFGQTLFPHVLPTGLAMMALAGEARTDRRIERSLDYLQRELSAETATASLCYGLLGLAAHGRSPKSAAVKDDWLERAYQRTLHQGGSPYKLALLALTAAEAYPFRATA